MQIKRRHLLAGAGVMALSSATGAKADQILQQIFNTHGRSAWNDQFDSHYSGDQKVITTQPIFSPATLSYVQQAISNYEMINASGGWPNVPATVKLELGVVDPSVGPLRQRLMVSGDLDRNAGMSNAFDSYVDAAVKRFQTRHGLPADGVVGEYTLKMMNVPVSTRLMQLRTNLVRLETMANSFLGDRYVVVNIPAAEIEAVEGGRVVQRHTAIVGKVSRQTPILNSKINEIIINPYWNAPESIIRKDIVPLMQKNPNYLAENAIRIYNHGDLENEIDPRSIDWHDPATPDYVGKLRFRQDPGKINAMASVKINFPNAHAVYMHDTPQQGLFNQLMRFESSGCVRVQNVRDLVVWLLRDTPGWDRRSIEAQIKTGESEPVHLSEPVPNYFTYITAWSTGNGVVHFRDDIYGRDGSSDLQLTSAM
ncbi:L,D-transpeptidase family protein [Notoacmeibacter ruber]|uniref:Murein L,D-transpeptidase n=1 Tax=Notoacmeibacter ruber TaxID=2670375 RepID=A0A3L7JA26_9HYPH|nr:L,D-transpeptidase family protein [Notoacmeibacter ruber]RLQ87309.1 murein L,D-transpeptidase [Notoacmeibacter ruber]